MRVDLFDFELPERLIALRPAVPKESARLLRVPPRGGLEDRSIGDLPNILRPGDALVFNDTRVIPAQLEGRRVGRGTTEPLIGATLHRRLDSRRWAAFVRGARKIKSDDHLVFEQVGETKKLEARVVAMNGGEATLAFDLAGPALDAAIADVGSMPLPPYIASKRATDEQDLRDYQTTYAKADGAVAAPTAGLHFTSELLAQMQQQGTSAHFVTLHVGAGTFLPMKVDDTADHQMHEESGTVTEQVAAGLNEVRARGGRIVAVGTTSLRLLESAADAAGAIHPFAGSTNIFITPGYKFRAVDALITNFHLPRSTLFMLVSAFSGLDRMRAAYAHAITDGYRFYSYGDACLLERAEVQP